ncbi:hypothetical protein G4B88_027318, partial [Cannabis sativa]
MTGLAQMKTTQQTHLLTSLLQYWLNEEIKLFEAEISKTNRKIPNSTEFSLQHTKSLTVSREQQCHHTYAIKEEEEEEEEDGYALREICFDAVTNHCRKNSIDNPDISRRHAKRTNNSYL